MNKKVSILMGVYNCEETLAQAIDSLLAQTYENWELILCDDGSSDKTWEIAQQYQKQYPERIILLRNEKNVGLNQTLNRCLERADGEYIARMDGDDLSLPERLEREADVLDAHPEYAIVSTPMIYFDQNGDWGRGSAIAAPQPMDFVAGTPFCHAPCMVRAEAYRNVGGYSTQRRTMRAEDYDLWFRMYAAGYRGCNLQTPYYKMRDDMNACHRRKFRFALNEAWVRFRGYRLLGLPGWTYFCALRPIAVGMLPKSIYLRLHRRRQNKKERSK